MKAGIVFTGTGPILILTSYQSFADPDFIEKLARKGVMKFLARELDLGLVERKYGGQYQAVAEELASEADLRVLDYNGHNVFYNFSFADMGEPIYHE